MPRNVCRVFAVALVASMVAPVPGAAADAGAPDVSVSIKGPPPRILPEGPRLYPIRKDGRFGYMDRTGRIVAEPQFMDASDFNDGMGRVRAPTGDGEEKHGYVDISGRLVILPRYKMARLFCDGWAAVDGCYIDKTGTKVLEGDFGDFSKGLAANIGHSNPDLVIRDKTGKTVAALETGLATSSRQISEGMVAVIQMARGPEAGGKDRGHWGFANTNGQVVVPCQFFGVGDFGDGLAPVAKDVKPDAAEIRRGPGRIRWGYVNRTGALAIPARFAEAGHFSEGLAAVRDESNQWSYIDQAGAVVLKVDCDEAGQFLGGLARLVCANQWRYIDRSGKTVWDEAKPREQGDVAVIPADATVLASGHVLHDDGLSRKFEMGFVRALRAKGVGAGLLREDAEARRILGVKAYRGAEMIDWSPVLAAYEPDGAAVLGRIGQACGARFVVRTRIQGKGTRRTCDLNVTDVSSGRDVFSGTRQWMYDEQDLEGMAAEVADALVKAGLKTARAPATGPGPGMPGPGPGVVPGTGVPGSGVGPTPGTPTPARGSFDVACLPFEGTVAAETVSQVLAGAMSSQGVPVAPPGVVAASVREKNLTPEDLKAASPEAMATVATQLKVRFVLRGVVRVEDATPVYTATIWDAQQKADLVSVSDLWSSDPGARRLLEVVGRLIAAMRKAGLPARGPAPGFPAPPVPGGAVPPQP